MSTECVLIQRRTSLFNLDQTVLLLAVHMTQYSNNYVMVGSIVYHMLQHIAKACGMHYVVCVGIPYGHNHLECLYYHLVCLF